MFNKEGRRTRRSFLISLIVHGILFVVLAFYIFGINERVEEVIEMAFLEPAPSIPQPRLRKPYNPKVFSKPVVVSTTDELAPSGIIRGQEMRKPIALGGLKHTMKPAVVTKYSSRAIQGSPRALPTADSRITPRASTSVQLTSADQVTLDEPTSIQGTSTSGVGMLGDKARAGGGGGGAGSGTGRGSFGAGSGSGTALGGQQERPGLAMTENTGAIDLKDSLRYLSQDVSLGDMAVPPLPIGEPGGRVIGRGRDIKGVFRFSRIKHGLSDWWADPTSLIGLAVWMNSNTKIRTDMNIEGGALKLTDAHLMKAPLVFMTGHDPAVVRQNKGRFQAAQATTLNARLTQPERIALRKYLVEAGGTIFYDDCGLNSMRWPLMQTLINELRAALPEYPVMPIPNDHEIYSCFYELGGPPWGVASLWKHGPKGEVPDYLKGLFIDGRIAVVLSQRDYLCGAKTVNVHAGKMHRQIGSYQFMTNVVIYALTHGKISDYSDYVPDIDDSQVMPKSAPIVPQATPGK